MTIHWCGTGLSSGPGLRRLIEAGLPVMVWNRTVYKAREAVGDLTTDIRPYSLPALTAARPGGKVRLWSAGASTGQEAYSLAIAALENSADVEIVATDLSRQSIERAQTGRRNCYGGIQGCCRRSRGEPDGPPRQSDGVIDSDTQTPAAFIKLPSQPGGLTKRHLPTSGICPPRRRPNQC